MNQAPHRQQYFPVSPLPPPLPTAATRGAREEGHGRVGGAWGGVESLGWGVEGDESGGVREKGEEIEGRREKGGGWEIG